MLLIYPTLISKYILSQNLTVEWWSVWTVVLKESVISSLSVQQQGLGI